jgi:hypothetical protein
MSYAEPGYDILIDNILENCSQFESPSITHLFGLLCRDYGKELFPDHSRFLNTDDPSRVHIIKETLPDIVVDHDSHTTDNDTEELVRKIAAGYRKIIARLADDGEVMYLYLPLKFELLDQGRRIALGIRYSINPLKKHRSML